MTKTVILIPSRFSASRLPGKPLLKINGKSIISHVVDKAKASKIGDVYVATDKEIIVEDVKSNGGKAILTSEYHKTGTDRIYECFQKLNLRNIDYIINLQGDEPNINLNDLKHFNDLITKNNPEIATLASNIEESNINNENIVKVITKKKITNESFPYAFDFQRNILNNMSYIYHHIGIYSYKPEVLKKFVKLKQTKNEIKNNLEQLRALDNGLKINVGLAEFSPIGVDTIEDYMELKKNLEYKS